MSRSQFFIGKTLSDGWKLTKENFGFLIGYQIVLYVVMFIFGDFRVQPKWTLWYILGSFVVVIVKMGFYRSCLLITQGIKPEFDQLYKNWRYFFKWIISSFFFILMLAIGFILFVIPGFYVLATFSFYPFFILDKNLGPIEALKESASVSKGNKLTLLFFFLVCIGINIFGFLLFGIGMLVTSPITLLAITTVYRKITNQNPDIIIEGTKISPQ